MHDPCTDCKTMAGLVHSLQRPLPYTPCKLGHEFQGQCSFDVGKCTHQEKATAGLGMCSVLVIKCTSVCGAQVAEDG